MCFQSHLQAASSTTHMRSTKHTLVSLHSHPSPGNTEVHWEINWNLFVTAALLINFTWSPGAGMDKHNFILVTNTYLFYPLKYIYTHTLLTSHIKSYEKHVHLILNSFQNRKASLLRSYTPVFDKIRVNCGKHYYIILSVEIHISQLVGP